MSEVLENLKYTKEHEWTKIDGEIVTIGITDFAQSALGDIVFVELPEVGRELKADEVFGVVESIKSVSDLYCPLSGVVTEINETLLETPENCNQAPYEAWMIKLKMSQPTEQNQLLDAQQYKEICEQSH